MASLRVQRHASIDAFEDVALPYLLEREAEHNLFIAICGQIKQGRYRDFYVASAEREGKIVGAAFRTPPFNLVLSHAEDREVVDAIATDVREVFEELPAVAARKDLAHAFAERWSAITGVGHRVGLEQRIYEADAINAPVDVPGELREATIADRDLLIDWIHGFNEDAFPEGHAERLHDPATLVDWRLGANGSPMYLWCTDRPVSMAGLSGGTPDGARVNAVYTPPELRRRGFASAVTAAVSKRALEDKRFCFLYTDLANPTSNSIYQKIGYRPVCDVDEIRFGD
jgi:hypothetical protein